MTADSFTEVTSQNVFQRLGQSFKGVLVGLVLLVIAFPLLWWNEGRAVYRAQTLQEGRGQVVTVSADSVDPNREGNLVHVSGMADTEDVLRDPAFGVTAQAIRLDRGIEMYQWDEETRTETRTKVGGEKETITHYDYVKRWSSAPIDSSRFRRPGAHDNPPMPYRDHAEWARNVTLGAFGLTTGQIRRMTQTEPLPLPGDILNNLPEDLRSRTTVQGSGLYVGDNPASPRVGDLKIRFAKVPPAVVTVVARQVGETFGPFQMKRGSLDEFRYGNLSADEVFTAAEQENILLTWVLRVVGFAVMAIGLGTIFAPLAVLGDVIPFIGSIMRFGLGVFSSVIAFALSLTTIAIAWITYRPLLGIGLLAAAMASVVVVRQLSVGKEPVPAAGPDTFRPPPPPPTTAAPPPPPPPPPPPR